MTRSRERAIWIAGISVFLLAALFAVLYFRRAPAETTATTRFLIYPPEKTTFSGSFAVSPDGRRIVFRASSEGKILLWIHALDSLVAHPLAGTEEGTYVFWSPDSRFVGFFLRRQA